MSTPAVSVPVMAAYALPTLATQFVYAPLTTVVPGVFAKYLGMGAAAIATALLLTRVFDALSDPLVGYLSDVSCSALGRRKPWLLAGTPVAVLAFWQLVTPGELLPVSVHFVVWSLLFYLGWTMIEIPHTAWGSELDQSYDARNRIYFTRTVFAIVGPLSFAAVPLAIGADTTRMTPEVLRAAALIFAVLAPLCVAAAVVLAPTGPQRGATPIGLMAAIRTVRHNGLFWRLCGVFVVGGLAAGINGTLQFVYLDSYLEIGDKLPYAMGAMLVAGLLGLPLWLLVITRLDKHRAWGASLGLASVWVAAPVFLTPGPDAFVPYLVMVIGLALSSGAGAIVPFSLLGDVVDFDELKSGVNRAGCYYAIFTFAVKLNAAVGGSIAFAILALAGYEVSEDHNGLFAVVGLKAAFTVIPAIGFALAALGVFFFPLNRRRQSIVIRALNRRRAVSA